MSRWSSSATISFKTGKQPWCLKPKVQNCWLPLELQRCHCAPKYPAANRGVFLLLWEQASKAQEPLYRIMQELKANKILLKDASIFFPHNLYYQPKWLGLSVRSNLWNRHGACTSKACGTTGQIRHRYQVTVLITNASSQELFIHSELNPSLHNSGKKPLETEELLKCVRKGFINIIINI